MDKKEFFVITLYIIIHVNYWIKNGMEKQSLQHIYLKKLCYEHHRKNFEQSILQGVTPNGLRINKMPAINVVSNSFMDEWNALLKKSRN